MEKIYVVATVARQLDGEYVFVRMDKGFKQASKADAYTQEIKKMYVGGDGKPKTVRVSTPNGTADCICEVGPFEVDIEE